MRTFSTEHKQPLALILSLIFIISASFYSSLAVEDKPNQSSLPQQQANTTLNPHSIFKLENIIIDPGHGGKDPGNVSPWGGIRNKHYSSCRKTLLCFTQGED